MPKLNIKAKVLVSILLLVPSALFFAYTIRPRTREPVRLEPIEYEWDFNLNETSEWTAINGLASPELTEEGLTTKVTEFDPYIHSPQVRILSEKQSKIIVAMKVSGNASLLKLYWITDQSPGWGEDKTMEIPIKADGELRKYILDLADHKMWKGTVTRFRFDLEPSDCYGLQMSIRYVKVPILGPEFEMKGPYFSTPIPITDRKFEVRVNIQNTGVESLNLSLSLKVNPPLTVLEKDNIEINELEPRTEESPSWDLTTSEAGLYEAEMKIFSETSENFTYLLRFPVFSETGEEYGIPLDASEGITPTGNGSLIIRARETLVHFANNTFGYGPVTVLLKGTEGWQPIGVFGCFASLTLTGEEGLRKRTLIVPNEVGFNESSITFIYAEDGDWNFRSTWRIENQSIKVENWLEALEEANITQFSVALHPGETGFTSLKDEALLPGLEWLVSGENSSNTLDISPPSNTRNSPHPIKVTIPVMSVRYLDSLVAMLWDPYYAWDGTHSPLSLQFASPNWVEDQNNHLFELFVPTVPEWVRENSDEAYEPYKLERGKQLSISFRVYAAKSSTILDAVQEWVRTYGLPEPVFPRELEEGLTLSMKAYLTSLWVPEKGWRAVDAPSMWDAEPYSGLSLLLFLARLTEKDPTFKAKLIARFNESVQLALDTRGSAYLAGGEGWQLSFHIGYLEEALTNLRNYMNSLISSQGADGEWGYQPQWEMDKAGLREVGITATHASEILRWARISGDGNALSAGLKALSAMERYIVPRGAQTWEIPLHSPDVFASAKALEACLEAYIATGDQKHLERAKYWALTGLPFIYPWYAHNKSAMLYASIPVYGASNGGWAWIGRPVQWCGLAYAHHLLRLSEYDDSFPWRTLGEGILSSGMRQQVTSGNLIGTFPDSLDLAVDAEYGPYLNPELIVKCTLFLLGLDPDLNSVILRHPSGNITVTSPAKILELSLEGNVLKIRLSYFKGETLYVLVRGFQTELVQKTDFGSISYVEDLETANEGWKTTSDGFPIIKVDFSEPEIELLLLKR